MIDSENLKKDILIDIPKCTVDNIIDLEPTHDWWFRGALKKSKRLISKAKQSKKTFQKSGYKYGVNIPSEFCQAT